MPDHAPIPEATSCGTDVPDYVGLAWRCGTLSIQRMGGMLAPLTLILKDGRQISPLYLAPWAAAAIRPELPPILQALRGEWPCVPFGSYRAGTGFPPEWAAVAGDGAGDPYLHGYGSNVAWEWARVDSTSVELRCRYPETDDIEELVRRVIPDPDRAAVNFELEVTARRPTDLPAGLHFTFAKPRDVAVLRPGRFRDAWTAPGPPFERIQALAPDRRFQDLSRAPASDGGYVDASVFPPAVPAEDLIQLNGVDGVFGIDLPGDGCRLELAWNSTQFPSVLLWISSRGLESAPWNGEHVALGVEPVCSAFALGLGTTRGRNPLRRSGIATTIRFDPDQPFRAHYRLEAIAIAGDDPGRG